MLNKAIYNDFTGFSFQPIVNGVVGTEIHSSQLGLYYVSDGSRYTENISPTMKEITAEIPGNDGTYWWKTQHTQKQFNISVAYDSVDERQRREIMALFNGHELGYLVFDELPFKRYTVKSTGTPNMKFICFKENGKRVYKGEGTLVFTAYSPYGYSIHNYLNEFIGDRYANKAEWSDSSGMLATSTGYDQTNTTKIKVYNAGDMAAPCKIYLQVPTKGFKIDLTDTNSSAIKSLKFSQISTTDTVIVIDSSTHLVYGMYLKNGTYVKSNNLYNKYITSGDFFEIPLSLTNNYYIESDVTIQKVEYNYLYF